MLARLELRVGAGGGAVLDAENRKFLGSRGFVVYLSAPLELLVQRTCRDRSRPLLQTENPRARLAEILKQRDPLYREVADMIVQASQRTGRLVARDILRRIGSL